MSFSRSGYTIIEFFAAISLVLFMGAFGFMAMRNSSDKGRKEEAKSELIALQSALEAYKQSFGAYPMEFAYGTPYPFDDHAGKLFNALYGKLSPSGEPVNRSPFLVTSLFTFESQNVPSNANSTSVDNSILDPWGRAYVYRYNPTDSSGNWANPGYVLYSLGPDGLDTPVGSDGFSNESAASNLDNIYAR